LKSFLADEGDRNRALKRGGGVVLSLDLASGEARYQREPSHRETPETASRWDSSTLARPKAGAAWLMPARLRPTRMKRGLVSRIFASWNQLDGWLRLLDQLRAA
jgi:hypothetical protein